MLRLKYESKASNIPQALSPIIDTEEHYPYPFVEATKPSDSYIFLPLADYWIKVDLSDGTYEVGAYEG